MKTRKKQQMSISKKLTAIVVSILLLFGLVTLGLSYYIVRNSNLTDMNQSLSDKGMILAKTIDITTLKSILENPTNSNPDALRLTSEMDAINDNSDSITNLFLITVNGENINAPVLSSSILELGAEYNQDMIAMGLSPDFLARIKEVFDTKKQQQQIFIAMNMVAIKQALHQSWMRMGICWLLMPLTMTYQW